MNRADRRKQEREDRHSAADIPEWQKRKLAAKIAAMERLSQQGISPQDLEKEYHRGLDDGYKMAGESLVKGIYAGVCLTLKELYHFGNKRCTDVLQNLDRKLVEALTSEELIDQVWDDVGIQLVFTDPFQRVQEKE